MIFLIFRINENVIDEDDDKLVKILHKNFVHEIHEASWGIGQAKGHDSVLVQAIASSEGGFRNIFFCDFELKVPESQINF